MGEGKDGEQLKVKMCVQCCSCLSRMTARAERFRGIACAVILPPRFTHPLRSLRAA